MNLDENVLNSKVKKRFETLEEDFRKIHGNTYSYTKAVYVNAITKLTITCPLHGDFEQSSNVHLRGDGCPTCGQLKTVSGAVEKASREFEGRANKIHSKKYDYSNVKYVNARTKVKIICPTHGEFHQSPDAHLKGKGCKKCATEANTELQRFSKDELINKFNTVHQNHYSYEKMIYLGLSKKIIITCPEHGFFESKAQHHLDGTGCPKCAKYGFNTSIPGILYYLKISNGLAYKIGITNRSVRERFPRDWEKIDILKEWYFEDGQMAYNKEKEIISTYFQFKYEGPELLESGNSELFIKDILNLDPE
jgi:hypothetical protein